MTHLLNTNPWSNVGVNLQYMERWKWVGHILRMDNNNRCGTALTWTPGGRRKVGRPKTTWRSTVENERRVLECIIAIILYLPFTLQSFRKHCPCGNVDK